MGAQEFRHKLTNIVTCKMMKKISTRQKRGFLSRKRKKDLRVNSESESGKGTIDGNIRISIISRPSNEENK